MPRIRRLTPPGSIQHVISRFVGRAPHLDRPGAREACLERMRRALLASDWSLIAYALMSTHIHWCLVAGESPASRIFKSVNGSFAQWLNATSDRFGPVFADRYQSITVPSARVARAVAYVHNNPVRAGLVEHAADSTWTSHRAFIGAAPVHPCLDVKKGLALCGFDDPAAGRGDFDAFVREERRTPAGERFTEETKCVHRVRSRTAAGVAIELATPVEDERDGLRFELFGHEDRPLRPRWHGDARTVILDAATALGVDEHDVLARGQRRRVTAARCLALWLWTRYLGRTQIEMAIVLGLGASGASLLLTRDPARIEAIDGLARQIASEYWSESPLLVPVP